MLMSPAASSSDEPVSSAIEPLEPWPEASPLKMRTSPLAEPLCEATVTAPVSAVELPPLTMFKSPPASAEPAPARKSNVPPTPPEPLITDTLPPDPPGPSVPPALIRTSPPELALPSPPLNSRLPPVPPEPPETETCPHAM